MDVSVIIVNYKTPAMCIDTVRSVFEKTSGLDFEVIVVDNASGDGSAKVFSETFGDRISIVECETNLGFGKANNEGIKRSSGDFVFLLNSDTLLRNNAIKILFDFMRTDEKIGIAGGNLFSAEGKPAHSYMKEMPSLSNIKLPCLFTRIHRKLTFATNNREFNSTGNPLEIDGYITGADMMIRRAALENSGIFDPDFFMYSEEVELTWRIKKAGYSVFSVPAAEITHFGNVSVGQGKLNEFKERCVLSGKCLFYEKTVGAEGVEIFLNTTVRNYARNVFHSVLTFSFGYIKHIRLIHSIAKEYLSALRIGEKPYRKQQRCDR